MAEAFFDKLYIGRYRGVSAGSQAVDRVNPNAVKAMAEVSIDISKAKAKRLTLDLVEEADIVFTISCGEKICPIVPKEVIEWDLKDPSGKSMDKVREIRDQIRDKIHGLIEYIDKK